MNQRQKLGLMYYVTGELPEGMTLDQIVTLRAAFLRRGWVEPCDEHPYFKVTNAGLLAFLGN